MPSQPDNSPSEGEQRSGLQPTELPTNAKPTPPPTSRWITFLRKMGITARLMGKEIYRDKLKWFDLRRADYRLGRKAYEIASPLPDQSRTVDRLKRIHDRLEALSRPINYGPSFKDKLKAAMKGMLRAMKIQILKFRRKRAFRKLGSEIRQNPLSDVELSSEIGSSKAVFDRIQSVNDEIRDLAAGTYFWARKPLLTVSIVFALSLVGAGIFYNEALAAPDLSTPRKAVQAFEDALQRNDIALASSLALANDQQLLAAKMKHDGLYALNRCAMAVNNKFGPEQGTEPPADYAAELAKLHEQIEGNKATVGSKDSFSVFTPTFKLERIGEAWKLDLRSDTLPSGEDQAIQQRLLKQWNEITQRIEKGDYKTRQEVADAITAAIATLTPAADANPGSQGSEKPGEKAPSSAPSSEATAWATKYRNAKFITRAELFKRAGPVRLLVRPSSDASKYIPDIEGIVRRSVAKHGVALTNEDTDITLLVDVNLNRSKVTITESGDFGTVGKTEENIFAMPVQVRFVTLGVARREDKFVELNVYPVGSRQTIFGKMGDLGPSYTDAFREAVNDCLDDLTKLTDADDQDDKVRWSQSLWSVEKDPEMYKRFMSMRPIKAGDKNPAFSGITKFNLDKIELVGRAGRWFDVESVRQKWITELHNGGYEVDSSADVTVKDQIDVEIHAYNILSQESGLINLEEGAGFYIDMSAIRVLEKNVVLKFHGELRRAEVYLYNDVDGTTALPEDNERIAPEFVNRSIASLVKAVSSLR